ncbi:nucleoside hydrolase [Bacillus sp. S/N-304-OC-R1]|uniref:nucleoside hydrolase n=1 Tax=Bacillus sp. S/N-304-OC-R1 TaxID=2758034 RepID=UPI001C8EB6F9|nr:nucleoside hydrolase [Bacillus sp. S/N-304-OC-R1]MBY0123347.1 nucleoside hydrolase [Bacillus sp. S/N-304-OC-R1]
MKKVIIDVDTGIDDAIGILLAAKSGLCNILGITTVCGNVSLDQATMNTKKVVQLLGKENEIKVVKGASRPLLRKPFYEHSVHGNDGIGGALKDMEVNMGDEGFAPDFIIEQAEKHKGEITFILLAPLTNMALAVRKEPRLKEWIKELVIMGGAVKRPGNITPTAEFNMYVDPEAAKIVLHSGIPITLVGLDVTSDTLLTDADVEKMQGNSIGEFVKDSTEHYINRYFELNGIRSCAMHDPLAVGIALDRSLVKTVKHYVDVETKSELCDGYTMCDFKNMLKKEPNAEVCLEVDSERFINMLVETLKK